MEQLTHIRSETFCLPAENIDTDQIYPARFLTTTAQDNLGQYCFYEWRNNPGSRYYPYFKHFDPARQRILVSGMNFGCGSSREHAAWTLLDLGFRAVVSTRFGDIFHSNAQKNGLLLVEVDEDALAWLMSHPGDAVDIDVDAKKMEIPSYGSVTFPLDDFSRHCLLNGMDSLDYLLNAAERIEAFERERSP